MTTAFAAFIGLCNAIAALPAIGAYFEKLAQWIVLWVIQAKKSETMKEIADAAAMAARAQTQEDRYAALEAWRMALSRERYIP